MKRIQLFLLLIPIVLLTGCSTSTGLSAKTTHSGFDNAKVVNITPHGNIPNGTFNAILTGIGAQWNQAHQDDVILVVAVFNQYTGISGAELNIDGEKITLIPTVGTTDMGAGDGVMRTSTRDFVTDLKTIEKIVNSKRTWLRVHTPTGSLENAVIDNGKDSKAYHALKRFMGTVNQTISF